MGGWGRGGLWSMCPLQKNYGRCRLPVTAISFNTWCILTLIAAKPAYHRRDWKDMTADPWKRIRACVLEYRIEYNRIIPPEIFKQSSSSLWTTDRMYSWHIGFTPIFHLLVTFPWSYEHSPSPFPSSPKLWNLSDSPPSFNSQAEPWKSFVLGDKTRRSSS